MRSIACRHLRGLFLPSIATARYRSASVSLSALSLPPGAAPVGGSAVGLAGSWTTNSIFSNSGGLLSSIAIPLAGRAPQVNLSRSSRHLSISRAICSYQPDKVGMATQAQQGQNAEDTGSLPGPTWVLYHYPCPDGVFAALAAFLYHNALKKDVRFVSNTVYTPRRVEDLPCTSQDGVYLLDFAGPQGFAEQLAGKAGRVTVLDHHKTALETLPAAGAGPRNLHTLLDMNRSGATVAWDFFSDRYRRDATSASTPPAASTSDAAFGLPGREADALRQVFDYIEDADLWKWTLPDSKAFSSGLKDLAIEFDAEKNPGVFDQLLALRLDDVIQRGRASLADKDAVIATALRESFEVRLGGGNNGTCLAVVVDAKVAQLRSELGNQLAEKSQAAGLRAMGVIAYEEPGLGDASVLKISLRSKGEEDTTVISQAYGGGGHKNASSFLLKKEEFLHWRQEHP